MLRSKDTTPSETIFNLYQWREEAADPSFLRVYQDHSTVVNENGIDQDFRIESVGNANMLFVNAGANGVVIGGSAPQAGYELTVNNDIYAVGDVSALTFTDRTPFPKDLAEAYEAVQSIRGKDGQVDHDRLHASIKAEGGRNLSALVSAQSAVISDLVSRIARLESKGG
jgi:hypothetical protein